MVIDGIYSGARDRLWLGRLKKKCSSIRGKKKDEKSQAVGSGHDATVITLYYCSQVGNCQSHIF